MPTRPPLPAKFAALRLRISQQGDFHGLRAVQGELALYAQSCGLTLGELLHEWVGDPCRFVYVGARPTPKRAPTVTDDEPDDDDDEVEPDDDAPEEDLDSWPDDDDEKDDDDEEDDNDEIKPKRSLMYEIDDEE